MSAAQVLNSQLHIDTFAAFFSNEHLEKELLAKFDATELPLQWGYCLQHKNFDLNEDEIMLYTFTDTLICAKAVRIEDIKAPTFPCVSYSYRGSFHTVGVCLTKEDSLVCLPEHCTVLDGIGVCSLSFRRDSIVCTSVEKSTQVFLPIYQQHLKDNLLITMIFENKEGSHCASYTYCSEGTKSNTQPVVTRKWGRAFPDMSISE